MHNTKHEAIAAAQFMLARDKEPQAVFPVALRSGAFWNHAPLALARLQGQQQIIVIGGESHAQHND